MKVRLLVPRCGPTVNDKRGDIIEVDDETAQAMFATHPPQAEPLGDQGQSGGQGEGQQDLDDQSQSGGEGEGQQDLDDQSQQDGQGEGQQDLDDQSQSGGEGEGQKPLLDAFNQQDLDAAALLDAQDEGPAKVKKTRAKKAAS